MYFIIFSGFINIQLLDVTQYSFCDKKSLFLLTFPQGLNENVKLTVPCTF